MEAAPVLGNELGVDSLAVDVPDGAGGVDAGGADALGLGLVPVEGGEGVEELAVAVVVELEDFQTVGIPLHETGEG